MDMNFEPVNTAISKTTKKFWSTLANFKKLTHNTGASSSWNHLDESNARKTSSSVFRHHSFSSRPLDEPSNRSFGRFYNVAYENLVDERETDGIWFDAPERPLRSCLTTDVAKRREEEQSLSASKKVRFSSAQFFQQGTDIVDEVVFGEQEEEDDEWSDGPDQEIKKVCNRLEKRIAEEKFKHSLPPKDIMYSRLYSSKDFYVVVSSRTIDCMYRRSPYELYTIPEVAESAN